MALFSKRHYEWLAHFAGLNMHSREWSRLASALSQDNPKFDREKFLESCREDCASTLRAQFLEASLNTGNVIEPQAVANKGASRSYKSAPNRLRRLS